jgi:hypothetical protein
MYAGPGIQDESIERTVGAEASTMPGKAPQWTQQLFLAPARVDWPHPSR